MCARTSAKGTLPEILRGCFGNYNAPDLFKDNDIVNAGFIKIVPGAGPVKMGPFSYNQWFDD